MPTVSSDKLVRQWSERFRRHPLAAGVVLDLRGRADEIWRGAFELLQRESPEYRNAVDDEFTRESKGHCNQLLRTIVAVAEGRALKTGSEPFDFVRTHAEWRARHHVPLIASLHAYRLAHRTYWSVTREALLRHAKHKAALPAMTMLSDFWMELFDHVGAVLAEAHAVEERLIVAQDTRTYVGLVDRLLRGLAPEDTEAQRLSALCGIRPGAPMAVALVRAHPPENGTPIEADVTLRALVRLIEQALPPAAFGKLVDARNGEVTVIACRDVSVGGGLSDALRRNGFGRRNGNRLPASVGISNDTTETARLPDAVEEARLALEFASAARPLMRFADIDLPEFLVRRANHAAFRLIPDWVRYFAPTANGASRELRRTISAFADCNLNVKQTARRVGVHTNTVYFRLNRIRELTGVDPRTYSGTSLLLTALRLLETGGEPRQNP
jgi:hypothetical protein